MQQRTRVPSVPLFSAIPPRPEQPILFGGEGGDQSILGVEQAIEARLRHARSLDDRVDADGADALAVEQLACRREDTLAGAHFALWRGAPPGAGYCLHIPQAPPILFLCCHNDT